MNEDEREDSSGSTIICKNCQKPFAAVGVKDEYDWGDDDEDFFFDCPICGTKNTIEEFKQLLADNFFTQKNEKQETSNRSGRTLG